MKIGIYPGSFDPITYGHIDIAERASKLVDKLIIATLNNYNKNPLFSVDEKMDMIKDSVRHIQNVEVDHFEGLLVDFVKERHANMIIRGLRAVTDFENELSIAQTNRELYDEVDTVFLLTNLRYSYLSSSTVREVAKFNGDISKFVTPYVAEKLLAKYRK